MSDDAQDLESGTEEYHPAEEQDSSIDDLKSRLTKAEAELSKVRKEAAARRVAKREIEQTSEEKIAGLQRQLEEMRLEKLRGRIAKEAGLDSDLADRIRGESEDEMLEDAKNLAKKYRAKPAVDVYAGRRGAPVDGNASKSPNQTFNDWVRNS